MDGGNVASIDEKKDAVIAAEMNMKWRVLLTCCGRENGHEDFATWADADALRESYLSGPGVAPEGGHVRSAIIQGIVS